jgi:hypothetical protein
MKLHWDLIDLRAWWDSAARRRWVRVLHGTRPRDLTNFGDLR